ncbi:MAG: sigma-54-dependent transcriptional regulator [Casimicrobium sp.]
MKSETNKFCTEFFIAGVDREQAVAYCRYLSSMGQLARPFGMRDGEPRLSPLDVHSATILMFLVQSRDHSSQAVEAAYYEQVAAMFQHVPRIVCIPQSQSQEVLFWMRFCATSILVSAHEYGPSLDDCEGAIGEWKQALETVRSNTSALAHSSIEMAAGAVAASRSNRSVYLSGSIGCGKKFLAAQIHTVRCKNDQPFVVVPCASLTDSVVESELFGHVKGAFTGAHLDRKGLLELAGSGTLVLDELCELSPSTQAKLLRVLQERRFVPLGGKREIELKANIVSTSSHNINAAVLDGMFREDLFHRLCGMEVKIPALAKRRCDIPLLVRKFLEPSRDSESSLQITRNAMFKLALLEWPGNIRQLRNTLQMLVNAHEEGSIRALTSLDLRQVRDDYPEQSLSHRDYKKNIKNQIAQDFFDGVGGSAKAFASQLNVSRATAYRIRAVRNAD